MEVIICRIYKHYKGDYYVVEGVATYSENCEQLVLYRALYGDGTIWARPYNNFTEKLNKTIFSNATQDYRFELQDVQSVAHKN